MTDKTTTIAFSNLPASSELESASWLSKFEARRASRERGTAPMFEELVAAAGTQDGEFVQATCAQGTMVFRRYVTWRPEPTWRIHEDSIPSLSAFVRSRQRRPNGYLIIDELAAKLSFSPRKNKAVTALWSSMLETLKAGKTYKDGDRAIDAVSFPSSLGPALCLAESEVDWFAHKVGILPLIPEGYLTHLPAAGSAQGTKSKAIWDSLVAQLGDRLKAELVLEGITFTMITGRMKGINRVQAVDAAGVAALAKALGTGLCPANTQDRITMRNVFDLVNLRDDGEDKFRFQNALAEITSELKAGRPAIFDGQPVDADLRTRNGIAGEPFLTMSKDCALSIAKSCGAVKVDHIDEDWIPLSKLTETFGGMTSRNQRIARFLHLCRLSLTPYRTSLTIGDPEIRLEWRISGKVRALCVHRESGNDLMDLLGIVRNRTDENAAEYVGEIDELEYSSGIEGMRC